MMKESKYNIFFNYENSKVGYNSYTNEFIVLDNLLKSLYDAGVDNRSFNELKEIHIEFYNFLIEKGFLVATEVNEFELVKNETFLIDNDPTTFELIVNPTMNCNFKCWYCYETHIKDSKMNEEAINSVIEFSKNVIEKQKGLKVFSLSFFGGEPLLYFDKVIKQISTEIFNLCNTKKIKFKGGMTTNGLLIDKKKAAFCKNNGLSFFQITLDGNRERHDKVRFISEGRGSYDKIVSNMKMLVRHGLFVSVRINCSKETMDDIEGILTDFNDIPKYDRKFLNFDFQKVWQEEEKIDVAMNDVRYLFKNAGFSVSGVNGLAKRGLDTCYADKRYQATINYNGEVFKCTARDFKDNSGEGILKNKGVIEWNERFEKRLNSKFNNAPCKECRILPICGGGCSQAALEAGDRDYCVYSFDEDAKLNVVTNRFKALIH